MTSHEKGLTYLLVAAALMSLDAVFIRLSGLHGFAPSFLFGVFSLISMTTLTQIREGNVLRVAKAGGFMLLVSGAIMGVSGTAFTLAVQKTTVANVLLIMSITPIFSAIFSRIFLKENIKKHTGLAILLSIIGIYIIVQGSLASGGIEGDLIALVCALAVSMNFIVWRKFKQLNRSLVVGAGGFFIALFATPFITTADYDIKGVLVMMVMGLFTAPVGRMFNAMATRIISAPEVSLISQIKIVIAPLIIWAIFGEVPGTATFIGGSLILVAALGQPLYSLYLMKRAPVPAVAE
ncbi:DMT family transporter [Cohaesibacter haloalkalitolerans]|uniref:DMT family transporter n=1 Tax=Cohaesibacter haloalkalitolerans TaxID=1162980 RepID=UPI0013C421A1|nr:DMT family transporter [Cohaesibacter haloalkalitolerans]